MTTPASIPVVLFTVADALAREGLPLPERLMVSDPQDLDLRFGTHADLFRWAEHMGLPVERWYSQRYDRDETPQILTNLYGTWRGIPVHLVCCEPTTTAPATVVEAVAA